VNLLRSLSFFALVALTLSGLAGPAHADPVDDALARFSTDKFDDTDKAIEGLIASQAANGAAIFEALAAGRLVFDPESKTVLLKDASGALTLAKTGEPAPADLAAKPLKPVRLNNRIRRSVEAARGAFALQAADH